VDQQTLTVDLAREVLGDDLLGAYLHGSAVLGGLAPGSDVDVLTVSRRRLHKGEPQRLYKGCISITKRPRTVELTVVVQADVRPWRYPPRRELQYGEWLRMEYVAGRDAGLYPVDDPDLTTLLTIVRSRGVVLHGPPPEELLDEIPFDDLRRAITHDLDSPIGDMHDDERNILLTLARMWFTLATGDIVRKDAAADWVLARADLPLLARARDLYLAGDRGVWDEQAARATARALVAEIRKA
jgi:predicted nucleotidyltransferase